MTYGPLIDLPLVSFYQEEDASRSTLVNGDFEGAAGPPPANWIEFQSLGTRQAGACPGSTGSFVGQEGYDGVNPYGLLMQGGMIIGGKYTHRGWCKPDGGGRVPSLLDDAVTAVWTGTATGVWQPVALTMTVGGTITCLRCANLAVGGWVQWDDLTRIPLINRTRNVGLLGGSVQLGDGLTPATLPTRLATGVRGFSFNGVAQYLNAGNVADFTDNFTLFATCKAGINLGNRLITRRAGGDIQYDWLVDPTAGDGRLYVYNAAGASVAGNTKVNDGQLHSLAMTSSGGVIRFYVDGRYDGGGALVLTSKVANLCIGANATPANYFSGSIYDANVFPYALSISQIRSLHERSMATLSLF